jgi:hypothetical protein
MRSEVKRIREISDVSAAITANHRFNLQAEIPDSPRGKTVLDELLRDYKNKISIMRAIMRLPKSSIRDVAMNAILEAFTK